MQKTAADVSHNKRVHLVRVCCSPGPGVVHWLLSDLQELETVFLVYFVSKELHCDLKLFSSLHVFLNKVCVAKPCQLT